MGAASTGMESVRPKSVTDVSAAFTSCRVRMLNRQASRAARLAMKEEPVPMPPMPGASPAQTRPLHTGQTRQNPLSSSLAFVRSALISIACLPWRKVRTVPGRVAAVRPSAVLSPPPSRGKPAGSGRQAETHFFFT